MRIAMIDTTPNAKLYPLSLMKLSAWRKAEGDECVLFRDRLPAPGEFDAIWLTTCFTFDLPHALGMAIEAKKRAKSVRVGGISATLLPQHFEKHGLEVHQGLLPEAEAMTPDYSLLGEPPEYSITHTTRGCSRRCGFCMVSTLEPKFKSRKGWIADIHPDTKKVLFYDNNWFAKGKKKVMEDIAILHDLVKDGTIKQIDFNQGLDCRLLTDEIADALQGLPMVPIRFAFDGMQEDGHFQRGVAKMVERGFVKGDAFVTYVLYNFTDTPKDFWYRLHESARISQDYSNAGLHRDLRVQSFPMKYQPILRVSSRGHVGKHWTAKMLTGFVAIRGAHSAGRGTISCTGITGRGKALEEFEYWFGKTADEFVRLLKYDKLRELMNKKVRALSAIRRQQRLDKANREPIAETANNDST